MVDSIKSRNSSSSSSSTAPRTEKLRSNFKNLSSGLQVAKGAESEAASNVASANVKNPEKTSKVLRNLNDAVSFSSLALKSLDGVSEDIQSEGAEANVVREFAQDLDKLREDIKGILNVLRSRAERAEVARENLQSSSARLRDVDAATEAAEITRSQISFENKEALEAHSNIDAEKVLSLLSD